MKNIQIGAKNRLFTEKKLQNPIKSTNMDIVTRVHNNLLDILKNLRPKKNSFEKRHVKTKFHSPRQKLFTRKFSARFQKTEGTK